MKNDSCLQYSDGIFPLPETEERPGFELILQTSCQAAKMFPSHPFCELMTLAQK